MLWADDFGGPLAFELIAARRAHLVAQLVVLEQRDERVGKRAFVARRHQQTGDAVFDNRRQSTDRGRDDRTRERVRDGDDARLRGVDVRQHDHTRLTEVPRNSLVGDHFVVDHESARVDHHAAVLLDVFTPAGDHDLDIGHALRNQRFGADQVLEAFVLPDAAEEQQPLASLRDGFVRTIRRNCDVRDHGDARRRQMDIVHQDRLQLFGMRDELVGAVIGPMHEPLRREGRLCVADMMDGIVHSHDERVPPERGQPKAEPHMDVLHVHDVGPEPGDGSA